jgi:phage terminase large subunit
MTPWDTAEAVKAQHGAFDEVSLATIRQWIFEPWVFVRQVFGEEPEPFQDDFFHALPDNDQLAQSACKGPGKTWGLSRAAWWWSFPRPHSNVIGTSITGPNLRDGLWKELAGGLARAPLIKASFTWGAERIYQNDNPATWFMSARQWSRTADPTSQADTLAGVHADFIMFIIDEAGGVPDAVASAAKAGLANVDKAAGREAKFIIAGNPTERSGPLWRACTAERHRWWVKEITGDPDDPNRARRVSVEWARDFIKDYGRDSPWTLVNVFGKFPPSSLDGFIKAERVAEAMARQIPTTAYSHAPLVMGVDPARFGADRSCVALRQGQYLEPLVEFHGLDTMQLAGQVVRLIKDRDPDAVFVDEIGIGAGVVDRLRELGFEVVGVNSSRRGTGAVYFNTRTEMWAEAATWLNTAAIAPDTALSEELSEPKILPRSDGTAILEPKDDFKKRLGRSPDKADAVALTFAHPVRTRDPVEREQRAFQERFGVPAPSAPRREYEPFGKEWN